MPVLIVKGEADRDAVLGLVTASSVQSVGGAITYGSSSYYTGGNVGDFKGILVPNADVYTGSFTTAPLWNALATQSANTVESAAATSASAAVETFTVGLTNPSSLPNNLEDITVVVDAAKVGTDAAPDSSSVSMTVDVIVNNNVRITRTFPSLADSIYNSNNIRLSRNDSRGINWANANIRCTFNLDIDAAASGSLQASVRYIGVRFDKGGVISAPPEDNSLWLITY